MQKLYDAILGEWQNMDMRPSQRLLMHLEKRGLIELRPDPSISREELITLTAMGQSGQWQIRRKPRFPEIHFCPVCKITLHPQDVGERCGHCGIHPNEEAQVRGYEQMAEEGEQG